jgi:hypothetical protein
MYLRTWDTEKWASKRQEMVNESTSSDNDGIVVENEVSNSELSSMSDDDFMDWLIRNEIYNPLEDMRPFYYATYNDVRSTGQVYQSPQNGGSAYIIDNGKGDEFQMASGIPNTPVSFMDILNSKVVFQTQKRIYGNGEVMSVQEYMDRIRDAYVDVDVNTLRGGEYDSFGESPLMPYLMTARDNKKGLTDDQMKKYWCSGKEGGINFDLPTEAQWEYCCRNGSTTAIPPSTNIGDKFEENHEMLDPIAWYKYKSIGTLPEPERFCTWRISKMLFGISKDKEQINNVYEVDEEN